MPSTPFVFMAHLLDYGWPCGVSAGATLGDNMDTTRCQCLPIVKHPKMTRRSKGNADMSLAR